jgi:hypothetical protein
MVSRDFQTHLLTTKDGGCNWSDQTFPDVTGLDWSTPERFGSRYVAYDRFGDEE